MNLFLGTASKELTPCCVTDSGSDGSTNIAIQKCRSRNVGVVIKHLKAKKTHQSPKLPINFFNYLAWVSFGTIRYWSWDVIGLVVALMGFGYRWRFGHSHPRQQKWVERKLNKWREGKKLLIVTQQRLHFYANTGEIMPGQSWDSGP